MKPISEYTDNELQQELIERAIAREIPYNTPKPLTDINWSILIDLVGLYINGDVPPSKHCIFEVAVESVYGQDVWDYINNCPKFDHD